MKDQVTTVTGIVGRPVVSNERWVAERKALLAREKALMRQHDELARALPWERVEKRYVFDTPAGARSLADLFAGRRQLLVQHFMLAPGRVVLPRGGLTRGSP